MARLGLLLALLAVEAHAENVLRGRVPKELPSRGLTDGVVAVEGSIWNAPQAVVVPAGKSLTFDLGQRVEVEKAAVQADNNEVWVLSASDDGQTFQELWRAPISETMGLATRSGEFNGAGRYFRFTPEQGDPRVSVAELELFRRGGGTRDSELLRWRWLPRHPTDLAWLRWAGAVALVLALSSTRIRRIWVALALVALGVLLWRLVPMTFEVPPEAPRVNWIRAMVALCAAMAIGRELLDWRRWPASRLATGTVLAVSAVLALLCFGNLGHPQFNDAGQARATWLHHYDARTYYPIAKYFAELRFNGVYAASAMAVAEDRGGLEAIGMRDLRTHEVTDVHRQADFIREVRSRFSPERWAAFKADAAYFRRAMTDGGFLGSMGDHGGNATPVWFLGARLLFGSGPVSDAVLWRSVIADGLLLLLAFAAIGVAFGRRTMLVAMVLFGAQDFYQFGSNWLGAPLRHDWLSLWALGLAALRLRWFKTAGALLAWAAMIRAFPALTFVVMLAPALFSLIRARLDRRPLPWRDFVWQQRPLLHVLAGTTVAVAVLFIASSVVFGPSAWLDWIHKVAMLDRDAHTNNLAFRTYVSGLPAIWIPAALTSLALVMFAARRARLETAAAMGVMLVPMVFNPANYYLHSVCILAVLADEEHGSVRRLGAGIWLLLLLMCVASWPTSLSQEVWMHFGADTGVLLVSLLVVLVLLVIRGRHAAREAKAAAIPPAAPGAKPASAL